LNILVEHFQAKKDIMVVPFNFYLVYLVVNQFSGLKLNYAIHAMLRALQFKSKAHGTRAHELCHELLLHLVEPHGVFMIYMVP